MIYDAAEGLDKYRYEGGYITIYDERRRKRLFSGLRRLGY
jgi:hypothetical protein